MIGKCLKDYFKCLKFYFVPLGILSIFTVIGLYFGITGMVNAVKSTFTQIAAIANSAKLDWNAIWNCLLSEVSKIDFNSGLNSVVAQVTSQSWLTNLLLSVAKTVFGDESIVENVTAIVQTAVGTIMSMFIVILVMIVIGFIVGIFVVKLLVRKQLTDVKMWKVIVFSLADAVFWGLICLLFNFLSGLAQWVAIVLAIVGFLSLMFLCLLEGYLFYGIKKIKLKKVLAVKNVFKLYLIQLIIVAFAATCTIILVLLFKVFVGIYLAIPIIEISLAAIGSCAEGYVASLVKKENGEEKLAQTKKA